MKNKTMRMAMSNWAVEPGLTTIIAPVSSIFFTKIKHSSVKRVLVKTGIILTHKWEEKMSEKLMEKKIKREKANI
jgi:hypothetical protein